MNELGFSGVPVSYFLNRSKDQNEKKSIYHYQNQTFKSISACRYSGVLTSFVQYLKIEEENRFANGFSPASPILENEKNLGTWLQET